MMMSLFLVRCSSQDRPIEIFLGVVAAWCNVPPTVTSGSFSRAFLGVPVPKIDESCLSVNQARWR
jgi:hypothetical protein